MPNNVYIGSRYVPIFDGAWDNTKSYEPLTIVEYGNNTYTSKRPVPVGTVPTNTSYWALTGNYNGQIANLQNQINTNTSDITALANSRFYATPQMFGAAADGVTDDTVAIQNALNTAEFLYFPKGTYLVSSDLECTHSITILGDGATIKYNNNYIGLKLSGVVVNVSGIDFDGNAKCAVPLAVYANNATIENCIMHNTDNNHLASPYSCAGLYTECDNVVITNNKIYNIHRTKINPGNISSNGINVKIDESCIISNNVIDTVDCTNQQTDCDGIHTSSPNTPSSNDRCIISNNKIKNVTGRFIKIQNKIVDIFNNDCVNSLGFTTFFKCVDLQFNILAEIHNNRFEVDNNDGSSEAIHIDTTEVADIRENKFISTGNAWRTLISLTSALDKVAIKFANNFFNLGGDYVIKVGAITNSIIDILKNYFGSSYRIVNTSEASLKGNLFRVKNNTFGGNTQFCTSASAVFNGLVLNGNIGFNNECNAVLDIVRGNIIDCGYFNSSPTTGGVITTTNATIKSMPKNQFMLMEGSTISIV